MTFKNAVKAAPLPVNDAYCPGKQGMEKKHRKHVECANPQRITGSVNLDSVLAQDLRYASEPRWDYGLGYKLPEGSEQAVWVEVHPAKTSEVSIVLKKLQWLRDWLDIEASELRQMTNRTSGNNRFVWIASSKVNITKNSPQLRQLRQKGIQVKKVLSLP